MKWLRKRIPAPACALIIVAILAGIVWSWTGVYDYRIDITNIATGGNVYKPYWLAGRVYNLDIPLYSYVIQYRLYENDEPWATLQEVNLGGVRDYQEESLLSRRRLITDEHFTVGLEYQVRIYCIDLDSNFFPNPDIVNLTSDPTGVAGWDSDNVKTFSIGEGVIP